MFTKSTKDSVRRLGKNQELISRSKRLRQWPVVAQFLNHLLSHLHLATSLVLALYCNYLTFKTNSPKFLDNNSRLRDHQPSLSSSTLTNQCVTKQSEEGHFQIWTPQAVQVNSKQLLILTTRLKIHTCRHWATPIRRQGQTAMSVKWEGLCSLLHLAET